MTTDKKEPTRLRGVWANMIQRCHNPNNRQYSNYGGRGITVCESWRDDYSHFKEWALKSGYAQGLTIDRIDNNDGYSPQNCRWATYKEQSRNKRSNRNITFNGETKCLREWSETVGISVPTISRRLQDGWSIEATLTTPLHKKRTAADDSDSISKAMCVRIKEKVKAKGLSVCKFEQMAGIANGTVGKLEYGKDLRCDVFVKITKALDVSVDYLLGITEE